MLLNPKKIIVFFNFTKKNSRTKSFFVRMRLGHHCRFPFPLLPNPTLILAAYRRRDTSSPRIHNHQPRVTQRRLKPHWVVPCSDQRHSCRRRALTLPQRRSHEEIDRASTKRPPPAKALLHWSLESIRRFLFSSSRWPCIGGSPVKRGLNPRSNLLRRLSTHRSFDDQTRFSLTDLYSSVGIALFLCPSSPPQ